MHLIERPGPHVEPELLPGDSGGGGTRLDALNSPTPRAGLAKKEAAMSTYVQEIFARPNRLEEVQVLVVVGITGVRRAAVEDSPIFLEYVIRWPPIVRLWLAQTRACVRQAAFSAARNGEPELVG